ncbi:DNA polymerase III subunit epsilon [Prosthecomicrobium hirschii]|uniref:DNA polymerase III subunit epsilon n=1 Tax=Prosthecodimorpha hirschii TaxID=665126 RepID=A0A0P6W1P2_9HYPH|nr:DNA polymerase III subunit epsilon [Prosthecomicrobium hirschii]KPL53111.1 DNA polymerase III subunit epsilon [Prosthecomicrobium hirschii]
MREIVLDTETTGLDPRTGDRVVEIGGIELVNHIPTGQSYHVYINPERSMPKAAFDVHGLSDDFLKDKPVFAAIAEDFATFIRDARLVIHNASFDVGFLNAEFARLRMPPVPPDLVVDTLALAKRRHPAGPNSLDALCSRHGIDNSRRTKHGALLDSELLAEVYIELIGGKQAALGLAASDGNNSRGGRVSRRQVGPRPEPLPPRLTAEEQAAHEAFVAKLGENSVWRKYQSEDPAAEAASR